MSSGFITESEAADIRQKRQEEWDKVRNADDPLERPEEPYDNRSLFDRLQEQKQKKDLEYEEAHKLKNMIKGLDDDEVQFLDLVDRSKLAADRKKELEEERELNDYRNRVSILQEKSIEEKLHSEKSASKPKASLNTSRNSQQQLLKGIVIKKNDNEKKRKLSEDQIEDECTDKKTAKPNTESQGFKCVAILPGLGCYEGSSSDDDNSSDSDVELIRAKTDILGRTLEKKIKDC